MVDTTDLGLWYIKGCSFDLVEYCDADYVEDEFEIKRTSGESQFYALKLSLGLNLQPLSSKPSNCGLPMFPQQLDSVDIVINEQGGSKEKDDATSYKTIQERQEWTLKSFLFGRK